MIGGRSCFAVLLWEIVNVPSMYPMKYMSLPPLFLSTMCAVGLAVGRDKVLGLGCGMAWLIPDCELFLVAARALQGGRQQLGLYL